MHDVLNILLLLASGYAAFAFFNKAKISDNMTYFIYSAACVFLFVTFLGTPINIIANHFNVAFPVEAYYSWGRVVSISAFMSGLIEFIRYSKPEFARFPRFFVILPVLIVVTYPFIMNTVVLKEWLTTTYEGGSLFVAMLMHTVYVRKDKTHYTILAGLFLLLLTFIIYVFTQNIIYGYDWLWQTGLLASIITLTIGFNKLETSEHKIALHNRTFV